MTRPRLHFTFGLFVFLLSLAASSLSRAQSGGTNTILIEAENFSAGGAWKVVSTKALKLLSSRQKVLSAPAQCAHSVASYKIEIPTNGFYRIWSRYARPEGSSTEHTIRVRQGGGAVFLRQYGSLTNSASTRRANIVWEPSEHGVPLTKGEALVQIIAGRQSEEQSQQPNATIRNVDCIFLTADLEDGLRHTNNILHELDRHLTQEGDCWMRVINPLSQTNPVIASLKFAENELHQQSRGHIAERIGARGEIDGEINDNDWIAPGDSSPWIPLGQALSTLHEQDLTVSFTREPSRQGMNAIVEFARHADGRSLLRRIHYSNELVNSVVFEMPPDIRHASMVRWWRPPIRTKEEISRD